MVQNKSLHAYYRILGLTHQCLHYQIQPAPINHHSLASFVVLNPLNNTGKRTDDNVKSSYNYLFEFDNISLPKQFDLVYFLQEQRLLTAAVYSGNKSIHCLIKTNMNLAKDIYGYVWDRINRDLFSGNADPACKHPSRLTRKPQSVRLNTGKEQSLIFAAENTLDISHYLNEYQQRPRSSLIVNPTITAATTTDRSQYVINCAKKKGYPYLEFIQRSLPTGSYPMRVKAIGWIKRLTYPKSSVAIFTKEEIYAQYIRGTSKHEKALYQLLFL